MTAVTERVDMIVVGDDRAVRAHLAFLPGVIEIRDSIADARRLLLRGAVNLATGDQFGRCDEHTVVAYTPDFVARFNHCAPEVPLGARSWRQIVLGATLAPNDEQWPFTPAALTRLCVVPPDIVTVPFDHDRLEAFLATKARNGR